MKNKKAKRYGFTLVELIFAIMVIAIAVMSLPMMTQVTSKGIESNIMQEAIFAASTELMGASSGYWDKNSTVDLEDNKTSFSRVIDITHTSCTNHLRVGHIAQKYHRRCLDDSAIGPEDIADTTDPIYINLNNAEHDYEKMLTETTTDSSGYKYEYYSKVTVSRDDDNKTIVIDVKANGDKIVRLKLISANIGEIDYYKKRMR